MKKYYIPVLFSSLVAMSFSIGSISEAVSNPIFNSQKPAEEIVPEKVKESDSAVVIPKRKGILATNDHFFDYPINKFPVPSGDGKENIGTLSQMAYMLSGTVLFGQKGPF